MSKYIIGMGGESVLGYITACRWLAVLKSVMQQTNREIATVEQQESRWRSDDNCVDKRLSETVPRRRY